MLFNRIPYKIRPSVRKNGTQGPAQVLTRHRDTKLIILPNLSGFFCIDGKLELGIYFILERAVSWVWLEGNETTITLKGARVGEVQKVGTVYFVYLLGSQKAVRGWCLAVIQRLSEKGFPLTLFLLLCKWSWNWDPQEFAASFYSLVLFNCDPSTQWKSDIANMAETTPTLLNMAKSAPFYWAKFHDNSSDKFRSGEMRWGFLKCLFAYF